MMQQVLAKPLGVVEERMIDSTAALSTVANAQSRLYVGRVMKAIVIENNALELRDVPMPEVGPGPEA